MQVKYYNSGNSQWESANPLPPEEIYIGNTPPAQGINAKLWLDTSVTGLLPASYAVADNCEQTVAGQAVLDAHQGYLLQNQISDLSTWDNTESDGFLYYRLGKLVIVVGRKTVTATALNQWIQVTTIPEGYRPITYIDVLGLNNNHGEPICMRLNTGGVINAWFTSLSGATAGANIPVRLVCTYVID